MKKRLGLGVSDFKNLIDGNYYFIDKSLIIKELLDASSNVVLIPRPRRFGKTLNMSMIKYFFEKSQEDNRYLFSSLEIEKYPDVMKYLGRFPVIFITFKDVKSIDFHSCFEKLRDIIINQYNNFSDILQGDKLTEVDKIFYNDILFKRATKSDYEAALGKLSYFLYKQYSEKVIILIDEYDVPVQEAYMRGYYDEFMSFFRNFLSGGLKDNIYLERAVLTGILKVAKESIFSGLNNLDTAALTTNLFSNKFGFTEDEVLTLANYYDLQDHMTEIKNWYNGYNFGNTTIYNPWSIINYMNKPENGFIPYWVNTSSNDLIKKLLGSASRDVKVDLETLISGELITKNINENIVMNEVEKTSDNLWSFLLFSGYLKYINKEVVTGRVICTLSIPNNEVKYVYEDIITTWFNEGIGNDEFNEMLKALKFGEIEVFHELLQKCVITTLSYIDLGSESEKFYHAFVLGMLVALRDEYEIKSNRESGFGRYDVMLIPKKNNLKGIIIEFKKVRDTSKETINQAAEKALKQIKDMNYRRELIDRGINDILELAIVFQGKKVFVQEG